MFFKKLIIFSYVYDSLLYSVLLGEICYKLFFTRFILTLLHFTEWRFWAGPELRGSTLVGLRFSFFNNMQQRNTRGT